MALSLVPLVLNLYDGTLNLISSGSATLVPSSQLNDVVDEAGIVLAPITLGFHADASPMVQIVPTDDPNVTPSGWAWNITFNDVTGAPEPYYFNIAGSGTFFSFTATGSTFTAAGSSFTNGTGVVLTGSSLPGGFWPDTIYYVVGAAGDAFSLAASPGGSAIASTSTGSGEVTVVQYLSSLVSTLDVATVIPLSVASGGTGSSTQNWQGLLTPVTVTQSSGSYSASAGALVKANISGGSWTIDLPNAPPNDTIVGAKVMSNAPGNTNTLTIACLGSDMFEQSSGGTTTTLSLSKQAAAWQYNSGYWTRISDDLPLGQLDERYAKVFSPMAYGAAGNGITDDTTAVQAAFSAASSSGGIVDLGTYTFKTSSAIPLASYIHVRGAQCNNDDLGGIANTTSDIFTLSGGVSCVTIEQCNLTASGGHVFNAGTASISFLNVQSVFINQESASHCIWYQTGGLYIDCVWGGNSYLQCAAGATVSPMQFGINTNGTNDNIFEKLVIAGEGATVPFFNVSTGSTQVGWIEELAFRDITFEVCTGGGISCFACQDVVIENCHNWDIPALRTDTGCATFTSTTVNDTHAVTGDLGHAIAGPGIPAGTYITAVSSATGYTISQSATATASSLTFIVGGPSANFYSFATSTRGYASGAIAIRGGRNGTSTSGSGFYDIYADSNTTRILIESYGWGYAPVISAPSEQTTILNPFESGGAAVVASAPGVAATGITSASTGARLVGGSNTTAGHPTVGAFLANDIWVDSAGIAWACTAGGTPGTWAQALPAAGPAVLADKSSASNLAIRSPAGNQIIFVTTSGNDANDGLSWGSAKLTIAGALTTLGSSPGRIQLGYGTWTISSADGNGNAVSLVLYQKLCGLGRYLSTIAINCAVTWGIQCMGGACEVSDLTVECGASGTCTYGVGVQGPTTSAFSAEECLFERLIIGAGSGTMTNGCAISPISSSYNQDVAETHFWRVFVAGVTNACFLVGCGITANILNTYMYGCGANQGLYGVYCYSTNFVWDGGTVQHNGTDFYFYGNCDGAESVIQNLRSENSGALAYSEPNTGGNATVEFRNIFWGGVGGSTYNPPSNGQVFYWGFGGVLSLNNVKLVTATSGTYDVQPVIYLNTGSAPITVTANGLISSAPYNELFVSVSPYSTVAMTAYIQLNSSTNYTITDYQPPAGPIVLAYQTTSSTTINGTSYYCMTPVVNPTTQVYTSSGSAAYPAGTYRMIAVSGGGGAGGGGSMGVSTLTTALTSGGAVTSLACTALPLAISNGATVTVVSSSNTQTFTTSGVAAAGATSISVTSVNANYSYPIGSNVYGTAWAQNGGAGAPAGIWVTQIITLASSTTVSWTVGAGGAGGSGGAAATGATGNVGTAGGQGGSTSISGSGITTITAVGAGNGNGSAANSSALAATSVWGAVTTTAGTGGQVSTNLGAGMGGPSEYFSGAAVGYVASGGGGGGLSSSTLGGGGGGGGTSAGASGGATAASSTANGVNGGSGTANTGGGSGGGGGGASGGAGGNGGTGGSGYVIIEPCF